MNYTRFINDYGLRKTPSLIREMTKKLATAEPGTIFMAGGFPNPEMFPFTSLTVKVENGADIKLDGNSLRSALQYQPTYGYPPLVKEMKDLIYRHHEPPKWDDIEGLVTVGSQQGLSALLELIMRPGDPVLVPMPVYSSVLSIMDPYEPEYLAVQEDEFGMKPEQLKSILEKRRTSHGSQPKLLYVNPTGTNPSGNIIPVERKKQIYQLAQEYDFLILEDDPYYFLHYQKQDPQSFLSLDTDGRVIRLDSFSKILSAGLRVGFATGPKEIIKYMELTTQHSVLHCSSLSQVVVHGVLQAWGPQGFKTHADKIRKFYQHRRDLMVAAAGKYLTGLAKWHVPQGGMFLWMNVNGLRDSYPMVMERGLSQGIMLLPGREFMADRSKPCSYVRASFSVVPLEDIDRGFQRLAKLIKDELELQK